MTTTGTTRPRPLASLVQAEHRQLMRNRTLLLMGTAFPIGIPLLTYFVARSDKGVDSSVMSSAWELFAVMALLFVQYYSVLSMVTTRRGEGVLRRLRTGEATDRQIQTAPAIPCVGLTLLCALVVAAAMYATGAPAPANVVVLLIGLVGGLVVFTLLALATSAFTKNAEAAQITSLPVMVIAFVGLSSVRGLLPDRYADLAPFTPFGGVADLVSLGATGKLGTAGDSAAALDFLGTFGQVGAPLATLAAWTVIAWVLAARYFRWDERE